MKAKKNNFFFCGFMGSGKSYLIEKLQKLNSELFFIDTDKEILKCFNYESIDKLILDKGWEFFREKEAKLVKNLANVKERVSLISLGGGVLCNVKTLDLILSLEHCLLIWINTPFKICYSRIKDDTKRPYSKKGYNYLKKLYQERIEQYEKSHLILDLSKIDDFKHLFDRLGIL